MTTLPKPSVREYGSGEVVEPGVYIDVENGAVVRIHERDELPEEIRIVRARRRFRRVEAWPTRPER